MLNRLVVIVSLAVPLTASIHTIDMSSRCGDTIKMEDEGEYALALQYSHQSQLECEVVIQPIQIPNIGIVSKISLYFDDLDVQCNKDGYVELQYSPGGTTQKFQFPELPSKICDAVPPSIATTSLNKIWVNYTGQAGADGDFTLVFSAFHEGTCGESDEYECDNGRCIKDELRCNGYNPCGDNSDCTDLEEEGGKSAYYYVGPGVVICVVVLVLYVRVKSKNEDRNSASWCCQCLGGVCSTMGSCWTGTKSKVQSCWSCVISKFRNCCKCTSAPDEDERGNSSTTSRSRMIYCCCVLTKAYRSTAPEPTTTPDVEAGTTRSRSTYEARVRRDEPSMLLESYSSIAEFYRQTRIEPRPPSYTTVMAMGPVRQESPPPSYEDAIRST